MSEDSGAETAAVSAVPDLSVPPVKANTMPSWSQSTKSKWEMIEQDIKMFEAQVNVSPGSVSSSTT
ncbi:MAG: hypothetical protein ACRD37_03120, partial [Candidatus Acidiferrales bacterium]